MVPPLKIDRQRLDDNNFINAYVGDIKKEVQYEDSVYLLFRPNNWNVFTDFAEREYDRTEQLIDDYDYEGGFVILVYTLDARFKSDFDLIKQGKYSKTSDAFQDLFPKVKKIKVNGKHRDEISLAHQIFKKTENLKEYWEEKLKVDFTSDMEYWEGFDLEKEILDIDKIKELV